MKLNPRHANAVLASAPRARAWACFAVLVLGGACTAPDTPDAGSALRGGKLISGPTRVDLVVPDGDGGLRPWAMPETLDMVAQGDGGWGMQVTLRARNVDPSALTVGITLLDSDTLAPLLVHAPPPLAWTVTGLDCVSDALTMPLGDGLHVARRTAVLDVQLQDGAGRDARARGVARMVGGPDGGTAPGDAGGVDSGSVDAGSVDAGGA